MQGKETLPRNENEEWEPGGLQSELPAPQKNDNFEKNECTGKEKMMVQVKK